MTLVSGNVRFMRIFAGVRLGRGVKRHWGLSTTAIFGDLGGYVFENFRDMASNIIWRYATHCRPVTECKMNDIEWPWVAISCQNPFSVSTSWIKALLRLNVKKLYNLCDSVVFCALHDELASLYRHAQLTRCFSICGSWASCCCLRLPGKLCACNPPRSGGSTLEQGVQFQFLALHPQFGMQQKL